MTNDNLSLYFHIPFCVKKCEYCAFYSLPSQEDYVKSAYADALLKQIAFLPNDRAISSVYFGGGTPPVLGIYRLCKLVESVRERFALLPDCEITVEVNPGTVGVSALKSLYTAGVNRLSVGVQSAEDKMLKKLGRIHNFDDALRCIDDARSAGFTNISADVMFALPDQSADEFFEGLKKIASLRTEHISAYSLQLEEGTPLYAKQSRLAFPNEDSEEAQYSALCAFLCSEGYEHYEISSFAKPGFKSRHNSGYWNRNEYFGFGAGAHSFYNGRRFLTPPDINKYIESASVSLFAPTNYHMVSPLSAKETAEEEIMLALRTSEGAMIPPEKRKEASRIASLGYGAFDGKRLVLNDKGFRVSNAIIGEILV